MVNNLPSERARKILTCCETGTRNKPVGYNLLFTKHLFVLWILSCHFLSPARSQFEDVSVEYGLDDYSSNVSTFGNGVSFFDFNEDGWDDLTIASTNHQVTVYENMQGTLVERNFLPYLNGELTQVAWVDFDNDGDNDLFISRKFDWPYLFRNDGDFVFTDVSWALPCNYAAPFSTCGTWADYDNDSYPDLYMTNYHVYTGATSWLFHNNGDGTFTEVATELGINNGVHAAYQTLWLDYDFDHDMDLFLVNDRFHGCRLYQNNGADGFVDIADSVGFNILDYCMGLNCADIDRDGDFDFYITNTFEGNRLLINDGGVFTEMGEEMNAILYNYSWGCLFIDDDNSGWEDLSVMCDEWSSSAPYNHYLQNDHGQGFIMQNEMYDGPVNSPSFTTAKGDVDHDGFYDMITMNVDAEEVHLWRNTANSNHRITVTLAGVVSNRNAIGSIVRCWHSEGLNMHSLAYGSSYMSQDSQNMIIGLGDDTTIDSLTVTWPSGWVDTYYNLPADSIYHFTEGETLLSQQAMHVYVLCPNEALVLNAPEAVEFLWENGEMEQSITVLEEGTYDVSYVNSFGLSGTASFQVVGVELESLDVMTQQVSCHDSNDGCISISDESSSLQMVVWDNGVVALSQCNLPAGEYHAQIIDQNGCHQSLDIALIEPEPLSFSSQVDPTCPQGLTKINWEVHGGTSPVNVDWMNVNPESVAAGSYAYLITDANNCSLSGEVVVTQQEPFDMTIISDTVCAGENISIDFAVFPSNEIYVFDWQGENPLSMSAGVHEVLVMDEFGCSQNFEFVVDQFDEIITEVTVTNDLGNGSGLISLDVSGGLPPYDFEINGSTVSENVLNLPIGNYQIMIQDANGCSVVMDAVISTDVSNEIKSDFNAYPNPFDEYLVIDAEPNANWSICDITGRLISSGVCRSDKLILDSAQWSCGWYVLSVQNQKIELLHR